VIEAESEQQLTSVPLSLQAFLLSVVAGKAILGLIVVEEPPQRISQAAHFRRDFYSVGDAPSGIAGG
jgi:hypothetical protein